MKVQNPIIGRARGSAGGMTFCKNYDKNVARAKAFEVSNPNTQAQQTQRNFFKQLTALCADFSEDQLRCLFPSKPKTMSRRNAISKQIAESYEIDGTTKSIDFADIDTLGNAPVMDFGETICNIDSNYISVYLDEKISSDLTYANNCAVFAIVNETKEEIYLPNKGIQVSDSKGLSIPTPKNWKGTDSGHAIPFITDQLYTTETVSFPTMFVIKRPARKND